MRSEADGHCRQGPEDRGEVDYRGEIMRKRVLYFPYIRIPASAWLTQVLLYWDQVSAIVPSDYMHEPDALGPYMKSLVKEELVWQVWPAEYIYEIPDFLSAFSEYLAELDELRERRARFKDGRTAKIHLEKMGPIKALLVDEGLAESRREPWYDVEAETAADFMAYLASTLGKVAEVDSDPVTDQPEELDRLASAGVSDGGHRNQLSSLRTQLLDRILPIPIDPISPEEIRCFKDKHGEYLGDFRRRVEREILDLASLEDQELIERHRDLFFEEADEKIRKMEEWMTGRGWRTALGRVTGVASALSGSDQLLGLPKAIVDAVTGGEQPLPSRDFAWAAFVRRDIG